MSMSIGRSVSPTYTAPTQTQPQVAQAAASNSAVQTPSQTQHTQASFGALGQTVVGKGSEMVNPSQGGQQVKQGIEQADGGQLLEQGQSLLEPPALQSEFSSVSAPQESSSAQGQPNLKQVSQHQVLNLQKGDSSVTESSRSVVLGDEGSAFMPELLTSKGKLDILGHGSPDGSTIGGLNAEQLAKKLKSSGITQLAVLDLKSCHSDKFKTELEGALKAAGITVGEIKTYPGPVAINHTNGQVMQGDGLAQMPGHDGVLGRLSDKRIGMIAKAYIESQLSGKIANKDIPEVAKRLTLEIEENILAKKPPLDGIDSITDCPSTQKAIAQIKKDLNIIEPVVPSSPARTKGAVAARGADLDDIMKAKIVLETEVGLPEGTYKIIALKQGGICHAFAFGDRNEAPPSFEDLATRTPPNTTIAVCFKDGNVAHTARFEPTAKGDKQWIQSIRDSQWGLAPVFISTEAGLREAYSQHVLIHGPEHPPITPEAWEQALAQSTPPKAAHATGSKPV